MVKNPPANAGDAGDMGFVPGSGRSLGGGNGNPLQYSCLDNPVDRGTRQAVAMWSQRVRHERHSCTHHGPKYLPIFHYTEGLLS